VRVARRVAIETSGDTILRIMHRTELDTPETPRVLGMDDWAIKKGQNYSTILVDLEQHRPVDLLPDREADTVATWLQAHPGVEIITRDRGKEYIEGATRGAPEALQVADRWHLLKNLGDALQRMFKKHAKALRAAAKKMHERSLTVESGAEVVEETPAEVSDTLETEAPPSHRQMRFNEVKQLAERGHSQRAISRQLHMSRETVRQYLQLDELPKYYRAPQATTKVTPYMPYLEGRLAAGCYNRRQLWREIQAQGFTGCYGTLRLALEAHPRKPQQQPTKQGLPEVSTPRPLSARQAAWLLVKPAEELDSEEALQCEVLRECCLEADVAYPLAQRFIAMFKQREVDKLDPWLEDAQASTVAQLRSFAKGLRQDYKAVRAALIYEWSNGQVEGQINRLKFVKRQMYGRAKFDLLRLRVLYYDDS
jgi:transposase